MSNFPERLDPAKKEVLDRSPFSRFFFYLTRYGELAENPQFTSVVADLGRGLTEYLGPDWQERYLPMVRHFDDSFRALSHRLSAEQKEDWMRSLLLMGFELGNENVDLFMRDIQTKMGELDLLDVVHSIRSHDARRGHDFVEAVMKIGADFRNYQPVQGVQEPLTEPALQSSIDWREYPLTEIP